MSALRRTTDLVHDFLRSQGGEPSADLRFDTQTRTQFDQRVTWDGPAASPTGIRSPNPSYVLRSLDAPVSEDALKMEAIAASDVTVLEWRTVFGKSSARVANPAACSHAAT